MKAIKNLAIAAAKILLGITIFCYLLHLWQQSFYMGMLPEKIEVSRMNYASRYCFFAIFDLSNSTVEGINQQGINFFKDATKARTYDKKNGSNKIYLYSEWQKTPVLANHINGSMNNGDFSEGLQCLSSVNENFDRDLLEKIEAINNSQIAFYTESSKGQLVIIPSLKIAIISGRA